MIPGAASRTSLSQKSVICEDAKIDALFCGDEFRARLDDGPVFSRESNSRVFLEATSSTR